jgi:hypothetical protein
MKIVFSFFLLYSLLFRLVGMSVLLVALLAFTSYPLAISNSTIAPAFKSAFLNLVTLFNTKEFATEPYAYELSIKKFMTSLAINDKLVLELQQSFGTDYGYKDFVQMLSRFEDFCCAMNKEYFQSKIHPTAIEGYESEREDIEELERISDKYKALANVIVAERRGSVSKVGS